MKSKDRWTRSATAVYNLGYHIIWCPKYRRRILTGSIADRFREVVNEKAAELNCEVVSLEVMPDHVHLFIKVPPTIAVHFLIQQMKGRSARVLRDEFPELNRKLPCMWTRSYYAESVGCLSEEAVVRYIDNQKNR